jgi:FkbM family methyltransferase
MSQIDAGPQKFSARIVEGIGFHLQRLAGRPPHAPPRASLRAWFSANGDQTLRLDYDLFPESLVFDVGGYQGHWSSDIFARFLCHIHIFEPISEYASQIEQRFARNKKIKVNGFGLAGSDRFDLMGLRADASSVVRRKEVKCTQRVRLLSAERYMRESRVERVDLLKINIEGMEYELLDHLLDSGMIRAFRDIQVQFHRFVPESENRMHALQQKPSMTHHLTYQFPFVWENWSINE